MSKAEKKNTPSHTAIGSGFKEQKLGTSTDWSLIRRLWVYMSPYKWTFLACLLLLPVISTLSLVQPLILERAIDDHLVPGKLEGITTLVFAFGMAVFGRSMTQFLQFYLMQSAGQRALLDIRLEVFAHVQKLSVQFFHKNPIGRLMTRITTDVESLQEALSSGMITMLGDLMTLTGIVVILLYKDWRLALIAFTVVPPLLILTSIFRHFLRKAYRDIRVKIAKLNAYLQESVTGMNVIQLFVRERLSTREYSDINTEYLDANIRSVRYDAMLFAVVEAVGSITIGAIIWYGSGSALDGFITIGLLVAFIDYMKHFFVPIRDLAQKYNLLQSAMASSERIFELLDNTEFLPESSDPSPLAEDAITIEFEHVWFAYNDEDWILRDVNFRIDPGEKIALVGHTGSGKSTILSLLLRLYDVHKGRILVNGVDIRDYNIEALRNRFAVVLQDAFLFRGTIQDNIALNAPTCTHKEVIQAAKTVHVHDLILRYEAKYRHQVQERGSNLSAGERQLISFARAMAHHPDFLLLDEATANVDTETEALIQQALETLIDQQTSFIIAHRLSTIRRADRILVLHKGVLIEHGTHKALLEQGGHYKTLYTLQYDPGSTTTSL